MRAALAMYDRPETSAANDRLWACIRQQLGYGPDRLTRGADPWEIWQAPDLVLAQTCGYPYRARLHPHVTLIGTPDHGLAECAAGMYRSVFVVRRGAARQSLNHYATARFAYNEALSQSGWAAPQNHAQKLGFQFENTLQSGAHLTSAQWVATGQADIAALDAISWDLMQQHDDFATNLVALAHTDPSPALPFISAQNADQPRLFTAVSAAIAQLSDADRHALRLRGLVWIGAREYLAVRSPAPPRNGEIKP